MARLGDRVSVERDLVAGNPSIINATLRKNMLFPICLSIPPFGGGGWS